MVERRRDLRIRQPREVDGVGWLVYDELTSRIVNAAQKGLDDTIARYDGRKVVLTPLLKQGNTRAIILEMAEDLSADLICIGTHGREGIARALIGSVAESVVRTSPVPVLTVHAPATAA